MSKLNLEVFVVSENVYSELYNECGYRLCKENDDMNDVMILKCRKLFIDFIMDNNDDYIIVDGLDIILNKGINKFIKELEYGIELNGFSYCLYIGKEYI